MKIFKLMAILLFWTIATARCNNYDNFIFKEFSLGGTPFRWIVPGVLTIINSNLKLN